MSPNSSERGAPPMMKVVVITSMSKSQRGLSGQQARPSRRQQPAAISVCADRCAGFPRWRTT
jgi:hypothetical protein